LTVPTPGFIRDAQRRAAAASQAKSPRALSPRTVAKLVRVGWDFKERLGRRIWSHAETTKGNWVSEKMAMKLNEERKG
jgi:hypothetical protein